MDIDRVRYFLTFADLGSLVKASEVLHISQPALSKALRVLESETGLKLLEAEGRGLRLTESGKLFRNEARSLLSDWLELPKKIHKHEHWKPTRIASFEVFTTYFLGHLHKYVDFEHLEIHEHGPGRMENAIAEGKADLAITYLPVPTAGVDFIEVGKVKMGIFGVEKFKSHQFSEFPFVIPIHPAEGTPSKVMGLDGWPDHRFERKIKYRVTMMESALELCREGHAVAYLPEFVAHLHNKRMLSDFRLEEFKSPISIKDREQSIFLIRKQGATETSLERHLAKSLRSLR